MGPGAKDPKRWTADSFSEAVEFHEARSGSYGWQLSALRSVQGKGEKIAHRREKWLKRAVSSAKPFFKFSGPNDLQFFGDFRDRYSRHAYLHIDEEGPLANLLLELMALREGCLLDVGSNMGIVAALVAKAAPNREVVALEPEPATAYRAAANFGLNGLANVTLINAPASDQPGELIFYSPAGKSESASVVKQEGKNVHEIRLPAVRVDELDIGPVSVVKFDVEGHEPAAIRGAMELLRAQQPAVIFEYHWGIAPALGWSVADIEAILLECAPYKFRAWEGSYPPIPGQPEIANIIATVD